MESIFNEVFKKLGYEIDVKIIKSNKDADFQCDDCFKLAKEYHKSPIEIGNEVVLEINNHPDFTNYFKEVIFSNPGFINIKVSDKYICDRLRLLMDKDNLGVLKDNKTIVLDYGGPNVAKPLHVGHLRSAIIGQAINNILKYAGNKTIADIHLGDFGLQIGQVIYGILNDYTDYENVQLTLDYLNETYPKMSALCKEDENVKNECLKITKELQEGNSLYRMLWEKICKVSIADIKRIYDYLSVSFDYWYGESDSFKEFAEVISYIDSKGVLQEDDGAKVVFVNEEDDKVNIPPCIIQKSDGAYLYATSDLGTIWQRKRDFNPDNMIYITDDRQNMHFMQVFRVVDKCHMYDGVLEHFGFGTVNGPDNKPFKTRSGGTLKLEDLIKEVKDTFINMRVDNKNMDTDDLDKIVNAIIKFADLSNDLEHSYIFDIKKFSEVNGKTGPYILYTYLRINKLITDDNDTLSNNIYNDTDRNLRLKLLEVSDVVDLSIRERKPHYIANYLYELSVLANNFYQTNRMEGLEESIRKDYNIVLSFNNKILKTLLDLLGIHIPKKM